MEKVNYNVSLLQIIIKRDNCIIDKNYTKLTRNVRIQFTCCCGDKNEKTFRDINKTGAFRKKCILRKAQEKQKITCMKIYKVDNPMKSKEIQEKTFQTNEKNTGYRFTFDNPKVQQKIKDKNMLNYGFEYVLQSSEFRQKIQNIILNKFGVKFIGQSIVVQEKRKNTCNEKYNVDYPLQNPIILGETRKTCLLNNGTEYPFQNLEIQKKNLNNMYNLKEYIFPDKKTIFVQGYENLALDILVNDGYDSHHIITGVDNVPEIYYFIKDTRHRYYCDIYLHLENKIIEVKSDWTFKKEMEKNIEKAIACINKGYFFEFWIFDDKKKLKKIGILEICQIPRNL